MGFARAAIAAAVLLSSSFTLAADSPPGPCSAAEFHQFDFWAGEWSVTSGGKLAGENTITPIHGGCALREEWRGAGGGTGTSLNAWDPRTKSWRQTWVSNRGVVLILEGGLDASGRMVMTGEGSSQDGKPLKNRITWSREEGGKVRQMWEQSDGKKWTVVFDGLYTPK